MKPIYAVLALALAGTCALAARAQISIDEVNARQTPVRFSDPVKFDSVDTDYFLSLIHI